MCDTGFKTIRFRLRDKNGKWRYDERLIIMRMICCWCGRFVLFWDWNLQEWMYLHHWPFLFFVHSWLLNLIKKLWSSCYCCCYSKHLAISQCLLELYHITPLHMVEYFLWFNFLVNRKLKQPGKLNRYWKKNCSNKWGDE